MHPHTANLLSISRIPASLAVLVVYQPSSLHHVVATIGIWLIVIISDLLDGKIARKYGISSELGYILDGLGDRAFHIAAYLVFLGQGLISNPLAWLLIIREISQYAVRLTEINWHSKQSSTDRFITRLYTTIVHALFFVTVVMPLTPKEWNSSSFEVGANIVLFVAVVASFARIVPSLWHAWIRAVDG